MLGVDLTTTAVLHALAHDSTVADISAHQWRAAGLPGLGFTVTTPSPPDSESGSYDAAFAAARSLRRAAMLLKNS